MLGEHARDELRSAVRPSGPQIFDASPKRSFQLAWQGREEVLKELPHFAAHPFAGEILLTSMDKDGTRDGYDLWITREVSHRVQIPVIASGGVGQLEHLREGLAVDQGGADAALAASIFHFGLYTISQAKQYLHEHGIPVRPQESPRGVTISSNSFG